MPDNFFHVPFRDERCDDLALMDASAVSSYKYIPRARCGLGVHASNQSAFDNATKGTFSDISNGDTLWIAGHGAKYSNDKIIWLSAQDNRVELSSDELAKWIKVELAAANVTNVNFILLMCFSANNWFGGAFGGKFASALKKQGITGTVKGFKGVVDDADSFRLASVGGAKSKGSSRISYGSHVVLNGLIQTVTFGQAAYHEAASGSNNNSVVYPIPN
ncbi:hypothetical protein A9Q99_08865 [Gammaproteobacteria bacterium 45_16_T64]|nr:hypothetical protein A9Q99_08865 [Gammaproteobacteria bacterium 45_16_T64]